MKKSKEEAIRWLKQAEHDFACAKRLLSQSDYSYVCFLCEQGSQKALKSYLYFKGERYIWEHSIYVLTQKCKNYDEEFDKIIDYGKILDKYYLNTRYPDAIAPPAIPFETFTEKEATEAIKMAEEIINLVKNKIG